jgi:hypothetical protein
MSGLLTVRLPDLAVTSSTKLPPVVKSKILSFGEDSYGASKVALVMADGSIVEDVIVAWGDEVVRVAGVDVASFDTEHVVNAINRR